MPHAPPLSSEASVPSGLLWLRDALSFGPGGEGVGGIPPGHLGAKKTLWTSWEDSLPPLESPGRGLTG